MTINQSRQGDITILQAQGRLDAMTASEADRTLATLIDGGNLQIVLDLSGLEYVSSAGLRVFLIAAKKMKKVQGKLALANPTPQVKQIFDVAGFSTVLPILATMEEALNSFAPASAQPKQAKTKKIKLTIAEEIYLLALDDSQGVLKPLPTLRLDYMLAAGILTELALCNRIDNDLKTLKVISAEPTGDPMIDDVLQDLQGKTEPQPISFWLQYLTARRERLVEKVLAHLVRKGILKQENRRVLWVFETRRYPLMDDRDVKEVRTRLRELILGDDIPDSREAVLISLGNAGRLLEDLFTQKEYERVHKRICDLAKLDLIGHEMLNSIHELEKALAMTQVPNI